MTVIDRALERGKRKVSSLEDAKPWLEVGRSAAEVLRIRAACDMSQAGLAQVLGVHPMTVSKWERAQAVPNPYQIGLLEAFDAAAKRWGRVKGYHGLGSQVERWARAHGVTVALYRILHEGLGGSLALK